MFRAGNVPKKEVPRKICALKRCVNLSRRIFVARCMEMPQSSKHITQAVSWRVIPHSAQRSLVKVESGIKGLLPTSWAPPIYSVSLLTKLRCALAGNGLLRLATVRSFLARICQTQKPTKIMKKSEKTRQGLYNVDFIGGGELGYLFAPQPRRPSRRAFR